MPGITERHPSHSPRLTYQPWGVVVGGKMCEFDPGHPGYIKHAAAGTLRALGVAYYDAARKEGGPFAISGQSLSGMVINDFTPTDVALAQDGVFDLYVNAAIAQGRRVVCGADGVLAPWDETQATAAQIVGQVVGKSLTAAGITRILLNVA